MFSPGLTPEKEIVSERRANAKVFDHNTGHGHRTVVLSAGPTHYKDSDGDWKEIDLSLKDLGDNELGLDSAPYRLRLLKRGVGYRYISRKGKTVTVRLAEIDGVPVDPSTVKRRSGRSDNRTTWQVGRHNRFHLDRNPNGVEMWKELLNSLGGRAFLWKMKISEAGKGGYYTHETRGVDNGDQVLQMTNVRTDGDPVDGFCDCEHLETWTGMVSRISDPTTRIKELSSEAVYPVMIDASLTETPDSAGDTANWLVNVNTVSTTSNLSGSPAVLYAGSTAQSTPPTSQKGESGVRIPVALPGDATVSSAKLKVFGKGGGSYALSTRGANAANITAINTAFFTAQAMLGGPINITGTGNQSGNVTAIVQAILALSGWASGNAMGFQFAGGGWTGTATTPSFASAKASFNGYATNPVQLILTYTIPRSTKTVPCNLF
jgi:hypothetical protein